MLRSNRRQRRLGRDDESRVEPEGCSSADGMRRFIRESLSEVITSLPGRSRQERPSLFQSAHHLALPACNSLVSLGQKGCFFFLVEPPLRQTSYATQNCQAF